MTEITYKQGGTTLLGNLTYEYDKAGNRTRVGGSFARTGIPQAVPSATYNAANQQITFAGDTLSYDNNGNLTSVVDPTGPIVTTWNARNQLIGLSTPLETASVVYDGLGRRQKKTVNGNLTEYLYDGVNPVQETSGATVLANILTGLGIDEYFLRTDSSGTQYLLPDALGSTIAVADSAGTIQTEYTYEPFGGTTATGAPSTNPFQYTGREQDGTGLYYYRARYYHPGLQRFISEDPFPGYLTLPQSLNWYLYVLNNPLLFVDPFGFDKCSNPTMAPCNPPKPPPRPCKVKDIGVRPECTPPNPPAPPQPPTPQPEQPPSQWDEFWDMIRKMIEARNLLCSAPVPIEGC